MPRVSEFFGIVIYMYYNDHPPPHFHARYGEDEGVFEIASLALIAGELKPRVRALVVEWAALHQADLMLAWQQCEHGQAPTSIEPL